MSANETSAGQHRQYADRFWRRIEKTDGCWFWRGPYYRNGYGILYVPPRPGLSRRLMVHRVSWTLNRGVIPDGMMVLHRCDNRGCVRPDHLFLGTAMDNARDMAAKGRQVFQRHPERAPRGDRNGSRTHPERRPRGELNKMARLSRVDVILIRNKRAAGLSARQIGLQHGVSRSNVHGIVTGRLWPEVGGPTRPVRSGKAGQ